MLGRLILLFTAVPFVELALLIWLGRRIGPLPTFALVIVTGVLGASLARYQGLATWARFRRALDEGRLPGTELVEGLMILVAGAVLLTPGVLHRPRRLPPPDPTDPPGAGPLRRAPAAARVHTRSRFGARGSTGRPAAGPEDDVIDAEYEVLDPSPGPVQEPRPRVSSGS